jgi:hypothetical protein
MLEDIQTWLQTPVTPAQAGPIVVMGALLLVAVAGGLGAFGKVRKSQEDTREAGETLIDRLGLSAYCHAPSAVFALGFWIVLGLVLAAWDRSHDHLDPRRPSPTHALGQSRPPLGAPHTDRANRCARCRHRPALHHHPNPPERAEHASYGTRPRHRPHQCRRGEPRRGENDQQDRTARYLRGVAVTLSVNDLEEMKLPLNSIEISRRREPHEFASHSLRARSSTAKPSPPIGRTSPSPFPTWRSASVPSSPLAASRGKTCLPRPDHGNPLCLCPRKRPGGGCRAVRSAGVSQGRGLEGSDQRRTKRNCGKRSPASARHQNPAPTSRRRWRCWAAAPKHRNAAKAHGRTPTATRPASSIRRFPPRRTGRTPTPARRTRSGG